MATATTENKNDPSDLQQQDLSAATRTDPDACLFVASLNASRSQDQLDASVRQRFQKFGQLASVKVMRDSNNRPYAFVQFRRAADADMALRKCQGASLDGRPMRIEKAHVNRTLRITSRIHGSQLHEHEIREHMRQFGLVDSIALASMSEDEESVEGLLVKYRHREDAITAFHAMKMNSHWCAEWSVPLGQPQDRSLAVPPYIVKAKAVAGIQEMSTVFAGNLNAERVTSELLKQKFAECGEIEDFSLFSKAHKANMYAYALIQYKDPVSAERAIREMNGTEWLDSVITVAPKEPHSYLRRSRRHTMPSQQFRPRAASFTTQQQPFGYWMAPPTPTLVPAIVPMNPSPSPETNGHGDEHVSVQSAERVIKSDQASTTTTKKEAPQPAATAPAMQPVMAPLQMPQMPMFYPMHTGDHQQQQFIYVPVQYSPPSPVSPDQQQQARQQYFMAYPAPSPQSIKQQPQQQQQQQVQSTAPGYNITQQPPMPMGMYYPPPPPQSGQQQFGQGYCNYLTPTGKYYADQVMSQFPQTPAGEYYPDLEQGMECMVQYGFGGGGGEGEFSAAASSQTHNYGEQQHPEQKVQKGKGNRQVEQNQKSEVRQKHH